eukprot:504212_1
MCCLFCVYYYGNYKAQSKILKMQSVQLSKMQSMSSISGDIHNETNQAQEGNQQDLNTTEPAADVTATDTNTNLPVAMIPVDNNMTPVDTNNLIVNTDYLPEEQEEENDDEYEYYEYDDDEEENEMMYNENNKHSTVGG